MDKRFVVNLQGKEFVTYEGLLNEAHTKGLKRITTRIIQLPDASNGHTCVVTAEVELEGGRVFQGIGDASAANVNAKIRPHLIRMAETRGKARALRDAVNVGMTAIEELGEDAGEADAVRPVSPQPSTERSSGGGVKPQSVTMAPEATDDGPDDKEALISLIRSEMKSKGVGAKQMTEWASGKGYPAATKDMSVVQLKVVLRYVRQIAAKAA